MTDPESPSDQPTDQIHPPADGVQVSLMEYNGEAFVTLMQAGFDDDEDAATIVVPIADVPALIAALEDARTRAPG